MTSFRSAAGLALGLLVAAPVLARAQRAAELPRKYAGAPTVPAITAADLMTRLYIFADDSMMGRSVGTAYNLKGTAYIEREVRRMGLEPAGTDGFFQDLPLFARALDSASTLTVDATTFRVGDFITQTPARMRPLTSATVIFGGTVLDTTNLLAADQVKGRVVVFRPLMAPLTNTRSFIDSEGFKRYLASLSGAQAVMVVSPAPISPMAVRNATNLAAEAEQPITILASPAIAAALFGRPLDSVSKGALGKTLVANVRVLEERRPGRNVVAIVPGSDARLKGQYIAIGAHNDHIGFDTHPVDHDSIRVFNMIARTQGADSPSPAALTAEQSARFRSMVDSLHALHGVRRDSIFNGADDDGSGSMSVLEIAESFASAKLKPKRSLLFVWHTGEEAGLWGSEYFTDHPTVSRDSIVAQLNMDMVGRGAATDVTGELKEGGLAHGGPDYLQLVGSRRLSTELGDLIERVNTTSGLGFTFDYSQDANGHPQNIYCRSDHYSYARYGIPVAFLTTGGHSDYHQVTDEPQYIDYGRMARVATLVRDAALALSNLDHRIVVDKAKPDPKGACVQ